MTEPDISLTDLRVVLAVMECASYTRASHKLNISQPAVSRRIAALESRLGVTLFRREGQRFLPSEAGVTFSEQAREVLGLMEELEHSTRGLSKEPRGTVAIGVPPSTGEVLIKNVLPEYQKRYPGVRIRIEQGYIGDLFEMLMSKHVDIALLNGEFNSANVYLEPIFHHHLGIVYPSKWNVNSPLGIPMPKVLTLKQVSQLPLFAPSQNQSLRNMVENEFRDQGVKLTVNIEINSFILQKAMVLAGHGCMFMSPSAIREADKGALSFVPIEGVTMIYTLYLAVRQFGQPSLAAKLMMKMIKERKDPLMNYLDR